MKHWWKILALCLVYGISTSALIACGGPSVGASNNIDFTEEQSSAEISDDDTELSSSNDLRDEIDKDAPTDESTNSQDNPQIEDDNENQIDDNYNENDNTAADTISNEDSINNETNTNDTPVTSEENYPNTTDDTTNSNEKNAHEETVHQHTCDNVWHVTKNPTCIENGSEILICSDCGETIEERTIPATGHTYVCITTPATCETDGIETYTCHCGDSYTITIPTLGHDYDTTTHQCTRCGELDPDYHATPITNLDPLQNPLHSYWYFQDGSKTFAFYFETFDSESAGNYCSYKGTVENGVFTPTSSTVYNGTYTIIADSTPPSGYVVHFYDEYGKKLNLIYDFTLTYKITINDDQVIYTLEGTFIKESLKTLTFAGYALGDEL